MCYTLQSEVAPPSACWSKVELWLIGRCTVASIGVVVVTAGATVSWPSQYMLEMQHEVHGNLKLLTGVADRTRDRHCLTTHADAVMLTWKEAGQVLLPGLQEVVAVQADEHEVAGLCGADQLVDGLVHGHLPTRSVLLQLQVKLRSLPLRVHPYCIKLANETETVQMLEVSVTTRIMTCRRTCQAGGLRVPFGGAPALPMPATL